MIIGNVEVQFVVVRTVKLLAGDVEDVDGKLPYGNIITENVREFPSSDLTLQNASIQISSGDLWALQGGH